MEKTNTEFVRVGPFRFRPSSISHYMPGETSNQILMYFQGVPQPMSLTFESREKRDEGLKVFDIALDVEDRSKVSVEE